MNELVVGSDMLHLSVPAAGFVRFQASTRDFDAIATPVYGNFLLGVRSRSSGTIGSVPFSADTTPFALPVTLLKTPVTSPDLTMTSPNPAPSFHDLT
ncbi:hypothetical protein E2C01_080058 [Portunus trituberculatus]|uniref:Uncharacterized protein n=1 Tax=Portunus trituberculatus TaxID=210409 RepID=A0A5B7IL59_PORTR|nr:hypothetical protein [Portunus trituberculatus]